MTEPIRHGVGIDLGTTCSSLAYVDEQKVPRIVPDSSGQTTLPSVVFFDRQDIVVGDVALQQAKIFPERVVQFIKLHMGDPWRQEFNGRTHTPETISALILGELVKEARAQIGPIRWAVITVPAHFTEKRRRATQQAGEIAGLEVVGTLNEPMAAALAYGLHRTNRERIVVIYDLGGGTFDVTVVRIAPNLLEELATNGNRRLGGRDWDQVLIDHVADKFAVARGKDLRGSPKAMQDLAMDCERAKRQLAKLPHASIRAQAYGHEHQVDVTREEFESMTSHLLQQTRLTTEVALAEARCTWDRVSHVVLVGGSTQMHAVRRMLHQLSGRQPDTGVNPVLAVSLGAAVYAHLLETGQPIDARPSKGVVEPKGKRGVRAEDPAQPASPATPEAVPAIRFVTAQGVGMKVRSGGKWANEVLISKNTPIPVRVTRRFRTQTAGGGTRISIEITQGDTTDLALVEVLGTAKIKGLPANEPPGQPVDITMAFDAQGRLHVHALYVPRNWKMEMALDIPGGLHREEIADHRRYLEETGFFTPAKLDQVLESLGDDDDDEDRDLPLLKPID